MTDPQQNDHAWFREHIAAALAGGLDAAERVRFDVHAKARETCAAELAASEEMERHMSGLFALPAPGMEDRIIESLRTARDRWRPSVYLHPAVKRAATAVAAVIVLGGFGYVMSERIERDDGRSTVAYGGYAQSTRRGFESDASYGYQASVPAATGPGPKISLGAEFAIAADADPGAVRAGRGRIASENSPSGGVNRDNVSAISGANNFKGTSSVSGGVLQIQPSAPTDEFRAKGDSSQRAPKTNWNKALNATTPGPSVAKTGKEVSAERWYGDAKNQPVDGKDSALVPSASSSWDMDADGSGRTMNYFQPQQLAVADQEKNISVVRAVEEQKMAPKSDSSVVVGDEVRPVAPAPASTPPPGAPAAPQTPEPLREVAPTTRKIIRNGQMEFEVDRYDAAFAQVSKLTMESGGYVGTTDSEKLPNGKVKGTVTVRVPPERLDTLVLQLRGIGDLKSQKLDANDVTKQYTDLESGLRAARAMEERLLAIIKEGKGQIKDLLLAEKELGVWREKIEKTVGEMRYFDNQVALSTLQITLYERDIKTPAAAQQTESIDAGMETTDVEKARTDALKAIEDAKGRVIQSDLKRFDAGQFGATIVAEVPPDNAGPLLDRLKQIGKVARLDIQRKQTTDPNADATAPLRVQKKDTRLNLSLYNLANVAPRTTSTLNLAADDVEKAYRAILDRVTKAGGRVISSNLSRNKPEQTSGVISFEVPTADADAVVNDLRAMGEMMKLTVTDNPDVNNVTTAKRGFALQIAPIASIPPRENRMIQLAAAKVGEAREKILLAASSGGARVLTSKLDENDRNNPTAMLEIDVPRSALTALEKALADAGDVVSRSAARSDDSENTLDSKVRLQMSLISADKLPPREVTGLTIEMSDVDSAMANLQLAVSQTGGRVIESDLAKERDGSTRGKLSFEVPLDKAQSLIDQAKKEGTVRAAQSNKNLQSTGGALAKARMDLSLVTPDTIVEPGTGPLSTIRNGLATSVKALLWSLQLIVIGLCTVLPFGLIIWGGWKLIKRRKPASMPTT